MVEIMKRAKAFIAALSAIHLFFVFKQPKPSPSPTLTLTPNPQQQTPPASFSSFSGADIDLEMMPLGETRSSHNSSIPVEVVDWSKIILEFCFVAANALIPLSFQNHLPLSSSFYVFCILILLAFALSLTGIVFRKKLPTAAAVLELMAIVFAVLAFFMAIEMVVNPPGLKWVIWVICALFLLSTSIYYCMT
ncbi:hypothetical protein NE237_020327 [Protea cynaroides]|uniref:Uncharacterized protein n=1 Tax=Protea cynaroides TaxID=273540 RepID=A0A9Q0HAB6_9MAGN|nr:hypothetical protein NE237_020327 [Protea cynaroides]